MKFGKRVCIECNEPFLVQGRGSGSAKRCAVCRGDSSRDWRSLRGRLGELRAVFALTSLGFYVFTPVIPTGPDLIVMERASRRLLVVEVKSQATQQDANRFRLTRADYPFDLLVIVGPESARILWADGTEYRIHYHPIPKPGAALKSTLPHPPTA